MPGLPAVDGEGEGTTEGWSERCHTAGSEDGRAGPQAEEPRATLEAEK